MARWNRDVMQEYGVRLIVGIVILILAAAGLVVGYNRLKNRSTTPQVVEQPSNTPAPALRATAMTFTPLNGWYGGKQVQYYDLGPTSDVIGNAYVLVTGFDSNGNPVRVKDQNDIYDTKRSDIAYSDFRELKYVTVPQNYEANSVKSASVLLANNWQVKDSGRIANRPQVLQNDKIDPDRTKYEGWVAGEKVYTWTFESEVLRHSTDSTRVATGVLYRPVTGYDNLGNPNAVSGQNDIFSSTPGQSGYSPLWRLVYIEVPEGYQANALKSAYDVDKSGYTQKNSGFLDNAPVYAVESNVILPGNPSPTPVPQEAVKPAPAPIAQAPITPKVTPKIAPKTAQRMVPIPGAATRPEAQIPLAQPVVEQNFPAQPVCVGNCLIVDTEGQVLPKTAFLASISNFFYQPEVLQVPIISSVTWVNNDSVPHTVSFENIAVASGVIPPGGSYTLVFIYPGTFTYHCSIHPDMNGAIVVQ